VSLLHILLNTESDHGWNYFLSSAYREEKETRSCRDTVREEHLRVVVRKHLSWIDASNIVVKRSTAAGQTTLRNLRSPS